MDEKAEPSLADGCTQIGFDQGPGGPEDRMITPAGTECRYYYEDYFRGRERQECRLLAQNPRSEPWRPKMCKSCPVPGILRANACPNLVLEGRAEKGLLGLSRKVVVSAICSKYMVEVPEPHIGCGHCHEERPGAELFNR